MSNRKERVSEQEQPTREEVAESWVVVNGYDGSPFRAHVAGQEWGERRKQAEIAQEILDILNRKSRYKNSHRDRITEFFDLQNRLRNPTGPG